MLKSVRLLFSIFVILASLLIVQSARAKRVETTYLQIINPLTGDEFFNFTVQQKSVGDTFVVNITIANVTAMSTWQCGLTWNSSLLAFVNASLPPDNILGNQNVIFATSDTQSQAQLVLGASYSPVWSPGFFGVNGTCTLAQVELRVIERGGQCDFAFEGLDMDTFLLDKNLDDMPFTPLGAHYSVQVGKTWRVPQDYPSISDALNAASNGDTIQVAAGSYPGFTVDKAAIQVAGLESGTIVDGTITVNADRVSLTGLTVDMPTQSMAILINGFTVEISNNRVYSHNALGILATLNVCTITNNFLEGTPSVSAGIEVYADSRVVNNTSEGYSNSVLLDGEENEVSANIFEGSISMRSSLNQILNNTISNGGVVLVFPSLGTNNNTITQNIVSSNSAGVFLHGNYNKITSNIIEAGSDGVNMSDSNGHDNEISYNTIGANDTGIIVSQAANSSIQGNTIRANNTGVSVFQAGDTAILGNNLESGNIGIYSSGNMSGNGLIVGNNISGCDTGVKLDSSGWLVFYNNFMNNTVHAEDNGNNTWYNYTVTYDGHAIGMKGNYWSGWNSSQPYLISGMTGSLDMYPLYATVTYPIAIPEFPALVFTLLFLTLTSLTVVFLRSKKKASIYRKH
jgi:parallel beta-helix repeat protein